jgi:hypothetical protein
LFERKERNYHHAPTGATRLWFWLNIYKEIGGLSAVGVLQLAVA